MAADADSHMAKLVTLADADSHMAKLAAKRAADAWHAVAANADADASDAVRLAVASADAAKRAADAWHAVAANADADAHTTIDEGCERPKPAATPNG